MLQDQVRFLDSRTESRGRKSADDIDVNAFRIRELRITVHPVWSRNLVLMVESGDFAAEQPGGEASGFPGERLSRITPEDPRWALFFQDGLGATLRGRCLALARSDGNVPPPEDSVDVPAE